MAENVRLVIWDLDETFWKGTMTEGGIEYLEQNHEIVMELARRGIISTICSKNDFATVQSLLESKGLWSYFILPSINWEPKGPRIAALIETIMLRPATIMFIDDNLMNLNEAKHHVPELQTADPSILPSLLDNPLFKGKDDRRLTRLNQYALIQQRREDEHAAKSTGTTNFDFLRSCDIRVRLEFDIRRHVERAVELVNRTNQLNFTRKRLPEDPEEARAELLALTDSYDVQAGLVHVADRYGDYGFVGFYAIKTIAGRSHLVHYCFSCRTLGVGVETWVYRNIGRPWLPTVGETLSDPRDDSLAVDWISLDTPDSDAAVQTSPTKGPQLDKLIMRGGCYGLSIAHYFHATTRSVVAEVMTVRNGMPVRLDHSLLLTLALDGLSEEFNSAVDRLGYQRSDFATQLFDRDMQDSLVLLDFWSDSETAIYRHKQLGFRIPFAAPYHFPVKPEGNAMELPRDFSAEGFGADHPFWPALRALRDEYEYEGLITEEDFKANLHRILFNIPLETRIFILAANETWLNPGNNITYQYPTHTSLNEWTTDVVKYFDQVTILHPREFFASETDAESVNHYDRLVYFRLYQAIASMAAGNNAISTETRAA